MVEAGALIAQTKVACGSKKTLRDEAEELELSISRAGMAHPMESSYNSSDRPPKVPSGFASDVLVGIAARGHHEAGNEELSPCDAHDKRPLAAVAPHHGYGAWREAMLMGR